MFYNSQYSSYLHTTLLQSLFIYFGAKRVFLEELNYVQNNDQFVFTLLIALTSLYIHQLPDSFSACRLSHILRTRVHPPDAQILNALQ